LPRGAVASHDSGGVFVNYSQLPGAVLGPKREGAEALRGDPSMLVLDELYRNLEALHSSAVISHTSVGKRPEIYSRSS